jgi:succinyl-CoA synthetase alpha subunit
MVGLRLATFTGARMGQVVRVLSDTYFDSVILMGAAAAAKARDGVTEAAAFMGTQANKALLSAAGFSDAAIDNAEPGDVILAVTADSAELAHGALADAVDGLLGKKRATPTGAGAAARPRSAAGALRLLANSGEEANLAVISLPGAYVETEAMLALKRGLNTFIFSDNVPVEAEVRLKTEAVRRGLLCMGPDCGTAWLGGVGIGFSNEVPRGGIGIISAAGTGLQAVACGLAAGGEGISHGIGVGGRDLSSEVGGRMTLLALTMLAQDAATHAIMIVSKPPAPETLLTLEAALADVTKPVVVACLGAPERTVGNVVWVSTLSDGVEAMLALRQGRERSTAEFTDLSAVETVLDQTTAGAGPLLGLFTGGTLAHEAELILHQTLGTVAYGDESALGRGEHSILDLGDDQYTQGRPHPMIDPAARADRIRTQVDGAAVVLLDLVLGRNSSADPSAPVIEAIDGARNRLGASAPVFVASVTGTAQDAQSRPRQEAALRAAGVIVLPDNAQAARFAARLLNPGRTAPAPAPAH